MASYRLILPTCATNFRRSRGRRRLVTLRSHEMQETNLLSNPLFAIIGVVLLLFWGFAWGGFKLLPFVGG